MARSQVVGVTGAAPAGQVDVDPRCEHEHPQFPRQRCNALLAAGRLTRPWSVKCQRCRNTTTK